TRSSPTSVSACARVSGRGGGAIDRPTTTPTAPIASNSTNNPITLRMVASPSPASLSPQVLQQFRDPRLVHRRLRDDDPPVEILDAADRSAGVAPRFGIDRILDRALELLE